MEYKQLLIQLIKLIPPPVTYVELGVLHGDTFNLISPWVARAVAVDHSPLRGITLHPHVELMYMSTDQAATQFQGEIDVLFIDACHEKTQLKADFDAWSQFVKPCTGLILLHDTCPSSPRLLSPRYCHNAWEFAWELRTDIDYQKQYEAVTLPFPRTGLTIIRKSRSQLCIKVPT